MSSEILINTINVSYEFHRLDGADLVTHPQPFLSFYVHTPLLPTEKRFVPNVHQQTWTAKVIQTFLYPLTFKVLHFLKYP